MRDIELDRTHFEGLAAEILADGKSLRFHARGSSMIPAIKDGDAVEIQPVPGTSIHCGDVVFCRSLDGRILVHRVVKVERTGGAVTLMIRGDAADRFDAPVRGQSILGLVVAVERRGRRVQLDSARGRLIGRLWVGLWPVGRGFYRRLAVLRHRLLVMLFS